MSIKSIKHLIVALITTFLLILPDYIFHFFNENYNASLSLKNILPIFALSILVLLIPKQAIQYTLFIFFFMLSFVQFVHFNFFGGLISPHGIILFFSEFGEIVQTLQSTSLVMINPFLSIIVPLITLLCIVYYCNTMLIKTKTRI